tara:strand:- start:242 stop:634 length:393 start_codon:yes stop_codon:yes gene_type:complete
MEKISIEELTQVVALLIHAAKIDEHYSDSEKKIILNFISGYEHFKGKENEIIVKAEKMESNSNQMLNFTNLIKKKSDKFKEKIVEDLWQLIASDKNVDFYETNLMRRICGLIYFSDKLSGEIKMKVMKKK